MKNSFALILILLCIAWNAEGGEPRRVLLLHSFGQDFEPFTTFAADFRAELARRSSDPLDFFDVALASARFESRDEGPFVDYLNALFRGRQVDLIVAMGGPAAQFAQKHRGDLFPEAPMVLTCVDERRIQSSILGEKDAAIPVRHDIRLVVESMLQLLPDTTNQVLVFGNSPLEKYWTEEFSREIKSLSNHLGLETFSQLSFAQMKKRAATLPPRSVILFGDLLVDAEGIPQSGDRALVDLHAVANAPIFGIHDFQLGHGIVGGPLVSVRELAQQSASAAARILGGESPANFRAPPMIPGTPTYDWRELRRWKIPEDRLPPGSVIKFRGPTTWERHWISIFTGILAIVGQAGLILGLVLNLRRRRKAERSLRESEERMKLAAGAAELGLWDWDIVTNRLWLDERARARIGAKDGESVFSQFWQAVHPDDRPAVAKALDKAIQSDGIYESVHRRALADGKVRWISARGRVEFDAAHKPVRMRGVGMDITARKLAEEEARMARAEAQRSQQELAHVSRLSALGELAGSLAHELNQPLAAIVSSAEAAQRFMKADPRNEEEVDDALRDIAEQGQRAGEIIARIRAMLKKDPGQMTNQNINLAVREALETVRSDLLFRRVTPVLHLDPLLPCVKGSAVQLRQVLLNLVMNACDAMAGVPDDQRQFTIESKRATSHEIEVSVSDAGPGFSKEILEHLFEPFRTTKTEGLGLGLIICRSIIRTHGGRLVAANNDDKGATLRFTLPTQDEVTCE